MGSRPPPSLPRQTTSRTAPTENPQHPPSPAADLAASAPPWPPLSRLVRAVLRHPPPPLAAACIVGGTGHGGGARHVEHVPGGTARCAAPPPRSAAKHSVQPLAAVCPPRRCPSSHTPPPPSPTPTRHTPAFHPFRVRPAGPARSPSPISPRPARCCTSTAGHPLRRIAPSAAIPDGGWCRASSRPRQPRPPPVHPVRRRWCLPPLRPSAPPPLPERRALLPVASTGVSGFPPPTSPPRPLCPPPIHVPNGALSFVFPPGSAPPPGPLVGARLPDELSAVHGTGGGGRGGGGHRLGLHSRGGACIVAAALRGGLRRGRSRFSGGVGWVCWTCGWWC